MVLVLTGKMEQVNACDTACFSHNTHQHHPAVHSSVYLAKGVEAAGGGSGPGCSLGVREAGL